MSPPGERRRYCLVIEATFEEFDGDTVARVVEALRELSDDLSVKIVTVDKASVRLTISLTRAGADKLAAKWRDQQLDELCGFRVLELLEIEDEPVSADEVHGKAIYGNRNAVVDRGSDGRIPMLRSSILVAQGQRDAALTILMQQHGAAVFRYCHATLGDDARADDVHQRVFIEAHRDLSTFVPRAPLRNWIFKIARKRSSDEVRSSARFPKHDDVDVAALEVPDPDPSQLDRLDEAQLREAVAACVRELLPDVRHIVLLRFQHGFTLEEIAEIVGEKPGTVQARVSRAMSHLRVCISKRTGSSR